MTATFESIKICICVQWLIYPTSATSHAGIGVVSWLVVVASILYCDTAMTSFLSKAIKKRLGKTD